MRFEQTIQSCFDHFPDLFQTREQVIDHLFCTIGNGYDWVDGELIEDDDEEPINNLDENGKAKQYNINKYGKTESIYDYIVNNPCFSEPLKNVLLKNGKTLEEHLSIYKKDNSESTYEVKHKVYPLCLKYSYIFNYPDNIKEDWLQGIKEIYEYIINNIEEEDEAFKEISKQDFIKLYYDKFTK